MIIPYKSVTHFFVTFIQFYSGIETMKFAWFLVIFASFANANEWWQNANFYQIYPRSFKDSNNDGIGDIRGIINSLDYLQELGVTATWLSPVLKSPQEDFGYDISDFRVVDPIFGTNEDLYELFTKAHERGIKVIMDFVIIESEL
jgi:1,4-alpha-glucan branching enzyme